MVLIATGRCTSRLFFHASAQDVVYTGSYVPLRGQHMYRRVPGRWSISGSTCAPGC